MNFLDVTVQGPTQAYCQVLAESIGKDFFEVEKVDAMMVGARPADDATTIGGDVMSFSCSFRVAPREPF